MIIKKFYWSVLYDDGTIDDNPYYGKIGEREWLNGRDGFTSETAALETLAEFGKKYEWEIWGRWMELRTIYMVHDDD